jgi:hypothetical protein
MRSYTRHGKDRPSAYQPAKPRPAHIVKSQVWAGWFEGWNRPKGARRRCLRPPVDRHYCHSEAEAAAFAAHLRERWGGPDRCRIAIAPVGRDEPLPEPSLTDPPWPLSAARLTR